VLLPFVCLVPLRDVVHLDRSPDAARPRPTLLLPDGSPLRGKKLVEVKFFPRIQAQGRLIEQRPCLVAKTFEILIL